MLDGPTDSEIEAAIQRSKTRQRPDDVTHYFAIDGVRYSVTGCGWRWVIHRTRDNRYLADFFAPYPMDKHPNWSPVDAAQKEIERQLANCIRKGISCQ